MASWVRNQVWGSRAGFGFPWEEATAGHSLRWALVSSPTGGLWPLSFFFSILFFFSFLFYIFVKKIPWFHLFQAVLLVEVFACWAAHAYIFFLSKTLIILPSNLSLRHFFLYHPLSCWPSNFCICPSFQQADCNVRERAVPFGWVQALLCASQHPMQATLLLLLKLGGNHLFTYLAVPHEVVNVTHCCVLKDGA